MLIRKVVRSLLLAQKLEALTAYQHTKKERINEVMRSIVFICSSRIEKGKPKSRFCSLAPFLQMIDDQWRETF